jgi:hypothetical protein
MVALEWRVAMLKLEPQMLVGGTWKVEEIMRRDEV